MGDEITWKNPWRLMWINSDERFLARNLMTASGIEQEKPRPDQAGVGVLVSPAG